MNNSLKTFGIVFVAALLAFFIGAWLGNNQSGTFGASGITRYPNSGMAMKFLKLTSTPGTATAGSDGELLLGALGFDSGSVIQEHSCNTVSYNPPALGIYSSATSSATTTIALVGAVAGDTCLASLTTATTTDADLACHINAAGTSTLTVYNVGATALDLATGTARVCYFGY